MRQTANATIIEKILNNGVYPAMFRVSHSKSRRLLNFKQLYFLNWLLCQFSTRLNQICNIASFPIFHPFHVPIRINSIEYQKVSLFRIVYMIVGAVYITGPQVSKFSTAQLVNQTKLFGDSWVSTFSNDSFHSEFYICATNILFKINYIILQFVVTNLVDYGSSEVMIFPKSAVSIEIPPPSTDTELQMQFLFCFRESNARLFLGEEPSRWSRSTSRSQGHT